MLYTKKDEKVNRVLILLGSVAFAGFMLLFDWGGWILNNADKNVVFSTEANIVMADMVKDSFESAKSNGCNAGMCRLR